MIPKTAPLGIVPVSALSVLLLVGLGTGCTTRRTDCTVREIETPGGREPVQVIVHGPTGQAVVGLGSSHPRWISLDSEQRRSGVRSGTGTVVSYASSGESLIEVGLLRLSTLRSGDLQEQRAPSTSQFPQIAGIEWLLEVAPEHWVGVTSGGTLALIEPGRDVFARVFADVGAGVRSVAFDRSSRQLIVLRGPNRAVALDPLDTDAPVRSASLPCSDIYFGGGVSQGGMWIGTNDGSGRVLRVDLGTLETVTALTLVGGERVRVATSASGDWLLATSCRRDGAGDWAVHLRMARVTGSVATVVDQRDIRAPAAVNSCAVTDAGRAFVVCGRAFTWCPQIIPEPSVSGDP